MYKLLTFNQDHGDEFDVPALTVMTPEDYNKWLELPSGRLNKNYEAELEKFEANQLIATTFWDTLNAEKIRNMESIPKHRQDLLDLRDNYLKNHKYFNYPRRVYSYMRAYLGNSSDGFDEGYEHLYQMKEFVEQGYVAVLDVSEEFATTFISADLERLSLCNVFTGFEDERYDEELTDNEN